MPGISQWMGEQPAALRCAAVDAVPVSRLPDRSLLLGGLAAAGVFGALLWLERRRPLRQPVQPKPPRLARNLAAGVVAAAVVGLGEAPFTQRLAREVEQRRIGLVARLPLPAGARRVLALLLMDYTLYLWHILLHRSPALWRWHRFHHADADLDASTALRFHAAELAWSLPWRLAQIALIGVGPATLALWGRLTAAEVLFHHSNVRLPERLESQLARFVMTPRGHGIHHANAQRLQHSNFSSGLAVWDQLHGTARRGVPQERITIGLPQQGDAPR